MARSEPQAGSERAIGSEMARGEPDHGSGRAIDNLLFDEQMIHEKLDSSHREVAERNELANGSGESAASCVAMAELRHDEALARAKGCTRELEQSTHA